MQLLLIGLAMSVILAYILTWYVSLFFEDRGYKLKKKAYIIGVNICTLILSMMWGIFISYIL
ncbi:MAG: hypothetical protein BEN19_01810 [Epulopiscium sp. Nuni2H_MBin003]|nr:MAG: hypothetical protein BEN19_01810 [Epulopiscium sp. Nuni2H_MBin003]